MKVIKFLYGSVLLLLLLTATSCDKWLNLEPQDGITKQKFWKSKEDIRSAVIGCYSELLNGGADTLFMLGEMRADMVSAGPGISIDEQDIINLNILPTNTVSKWGALYRVINNCNTVIDYAPQVDDATLTAEERNGYIGEALALRSLMYFYLVRSWGDVPLKLTSTSSDSEIKNIGKTAQADVLKQVVSDLQLAKQYTLSSYGTSAANKGRLTKYGVETILADVYLWMEQYDNCITECDNIISSNQFGLVRNNASWYYNLYYAGNSGEGIFELQFDVSGAANNFYNMLRASKRRYIASPKAMDFFATTETDATKYDIRGDAAYDATSSIITKYSSDIPSYVHWFVYRYADVLLMKAEACAQVGRGAEALELVKVIRERAGAVEATLETPDENDTRAVSDYILNERAREFIFEGKRWYDVLRNAKRNNYENIDILLNMVAGTVPANLQQSAIAKYQDHNSHYLPIYVNEITADPTLQQNPFYK